MYRNLFNSASKQAESKHLEFLKAAEIRNAIAASRNDPRPLIDADTVFAELDAIIDDVAKRTCRR
ncbi:hypothetical protein RHM58_09220 [Pseudomonas sp. 10S4]|uniref:hypothetical protein n=1 Tax=Pseudomonas sp. 10S4 TaxID=3048583 RepID=UPI002AC97DB8|nr:MULTISPECIES: hypothetical protein [unclassified Pseudomonas]WPX20098.1 hypothetical protein RHM58_09220 [Pseudomonas sp. 10S4]